jgi:diguanylate cyclase (GGDEF)-like protein/PAS domain S-box-containing protein
MIYMSIFSNMSLKTKFILLMIFAFLSSTVYSLQATTPKVKSEQKTLIVGSEQNFPPFSTGMTDSTAGGFTVDFWKAVAAEAGLEYTLRVLPFRQILQEFKEGKIDVLINLAISDERREFTDFSVPHVIVHGAVFVRKDTIDIQSEADLLGQSIIVLNADLAHDYAISKGWAKQLILVDTVAEGLKLLASDKHDAMLISKLVGMQSLQQLGLTNIKPLKGRAGFSQKFAFAVPKGQSDLLGYINEAMAITNTNGIYTTLYDKWFGIYEVKELTPYNLLRYISLFIASILAINGYFYFQRKIERKQVKLREKSRSHVLELITSDEQLPVILGAIVHGVEQENPAMLCSILLLDDTGKHLLGGAAPSLPDFYNKAVHGIAIGAEVGSCGAAAFTNERVIVEDIQNHPYWTPYKELAGKAELGSCWSEPIRSTQGKVLGTFAIYHHEVNQPTEVNIALIEQVASLASIAIEKIQTKLALQSSEERYSLAMKGTQDGLWDWNLLTNEVLFSPRWKSMLGYAENEIKNEFSEWELLMHPHDLDTTLLKVKELLNHKTQEYKAEFRMQHKDGQYINILARAFACEDEAGKVIRLVGTHLDITEQKLSEEKLKLAASVFSHAGESIVITDASGTILDVNNTFSRTTGYSREEAVGKTPRIVQSERQSSEFYVDMWQALVTENYWSGEIWNRRKNGEVYAEIKTISAVHDKHGITTHYVALSNDITPMKEHQEQLERIAHYDVLTNLPNRSLLADRLSQAMLQCSRHAQSIAVVFLDLDGFKHVNDAHGHDVGDELLIALSLRMKEALRDGDSLARIGGDEFVVVLADLVKVKDYEPVLERLLLAASEPITVDGIVLNVSASIGVTLYPQDNVDADQLMRHADQAMYVAKESGKNRYHLFDTIQDNAVKLELESLDAIRSALDNHQFVLHYQPKVNMKKGTVTGVEALIRWQHPERGLLNPIDFLPVIENNPMMIEMGEWVIDTALTQISQWQTMRLNLPVNTSVNIAAVQLQQPDFTQRLTKLLAAHPDVEPRHLELEVLETSALEDVNNVSTIMNACMTLGVNFALDDFGTGYSSLTYLRRLPANLIKIDQTFVRDMLNDPDDLAIVEGVIALAKSFKRNVIAEGVETIEHGTALLQLGCELAQGYGIARPMPASDIPAWVTDWKPDISWQI